MIAEINSKDDLTTLSKSGLLGLYKQFEVTEIFQYNKTETKASNVFTIFVAIETNNPITEVKYLTDKLIKISKLKNHFFGIKRYFLSISDVCDFFNKVDGKKMLTTSGHELFTGSLISIPKQFVRPDNDLGKVPWNRVLKNNFWNGSYILDWHPENRAHLGELLSEPTIIRELSDEIQKSVPIELASLSDKIGHVVIQLPITIIAPKVFNVKNRTGIDLAWHPKAKKRELIATYENNFDNATLAYSLQRIKNDTVFFYNHHDLSTDQIKIWDNKNQLLIYDSGELSQIRTVSLKMGFSNPEPRVFCIFDENIQKNPQRISINENMDSVINLTEYKDFGKEVRNRLYEDETRKLAENRKFVQYKPDKPDLNEKIKESYHNEALTHIRDLINKHGQYGVWLWDTYLSANDILKTLFFNPHAHSKMRAISSLNKNKIIESKSYLDNCDSNYVGLNLEFRTKWGSNGYNFHDRFLIFLDENKKTRAWSLGISVNQFGTSHHILQHVDDGQRVGDAFLELWNELDQPENLVWKSFK